MPTEEIGTGRQHVGVRTCSHLLLKDKEGTAISNGMLSLNLLIDESRSR